MARLAPVLCAVIDVVGALTRGGLMNEYDVPIGLSSSDELLAVPVEMCDNGGVARPAPAREPRLLRSESSERWISER